MKNLLKENEEKERTREKEEKENHHHHHLAPRASRYYNVESANEFFTKPLIDSNIAQANYKDPIGNDPRKVPEQWNDDMRAWFDFVKIYCARKSLDYPISLIKAWIEFADEVDYYLPKGDKMTGRNFMRSLRMFKAKQNSVALDKEREKEAREKLIAKAKKNAERELANKTPSELADERRAKKRVFTPAEWQLCFEECANCAERPDGSRYCARGCAVPAPERAPRRIHPRECAHYQKRDEV